MKILHALTDMDPRKGGVCQAVRTMIYGLTGLGNHNEVVCLNDPRAPFLKEDQFKVHAVGPAKGPWAYSSNLSTWLLQNLHHFDVVIIHGLWQYHEYAVAKSIGNHRTQLENRKSAHRSPKLFVMPHGMLDPYFQRAEGRKLKAIRNVVYWEIIERKIINGADGLLFTCEEECRLAKTTFRRYNPKEELIVGLGVENPPLATEYMYKAFSEKCPGLKGNPYILFLSRIHEKKGVDLLVNAYIEVYKNSKKLHSMIPSLVIAGPGLESPYGQALQQLVKDSGLSDSILFPGMLVKEAKWGAFYSCDAFVLPSHQENFGIAVVEALACGKPVLISNQVNIWREIETARGGIVEQNTFQGTVQLLERWKNLPLETQRSMGAQARHAFEKNFAVEPAARRMLEAIGKN